MNRKIVKLVVLSLLITIVAAHARSTVLAPGYDFNLFKNTPADSLAQAVKREDVKEIGEIISKDSCLIDFKEEQFGHTVLFLAVANNLEYL